MFETSKSRPVSVRPSSSARNDASSISAPGHSTSVAMFSSARGNGSSLLAQATLSTMTSSASRVRGTGSKCPASRPSARTNARCSLTSLARNRSATRARWSSRRGSGRSAPPSERLRPCTMTGTPRVTIRVSAGGISSSWTFSAVTSIKPSASRRSMASASSGRQPIPRPRLTIMHTRYIRRSRHIRRRLRSRSFWV